ncbi:MAG: cation:proton antiporter [Candidatus Obscuribacterales bacterium]|nr:cation:proton antiporter [Candidatus Obscuribacterales bacterium]
MSFELLFLIVLAGLFGPLLSGNRRFTLPLVVGEIIAGIAIGKSGFAWVDPAEPLFAFLSSVGFAFLLFLVGVKLPLRDPGLRSALKSASLATFLSFALAVPFGFGLAYLSHVPNVGLFILLCACSSTSTVVPILLERNLNGRTIVLTTAWIAMADVASMVALPLVMATGNTRSVVLGAVLVTLAAVGCFVGMKFFRLSKTGERLRALSKEKHWALDLRLSLGMLFGLAWLATKFGTSVLVAGFAAGMVASLVGHPRRFYKQLIGLGEGFLVPLFFVHLGASIDVSELFSSFWQVGLALSIALSAMLVHVLAARFAKLPIASGLSASAQMGLPAALVSMALANGLLTPGQGASLIAAALLSLLTCSLGVKLLATCPGVEQGKGHKAEEDSEDSES